MAEVGDGHGRIIARGDGVEGLLERVARARDDARRLNLPLAAHLLDMVCLDLTYASGHPEQRAG